MSRAVRLESGWLSRQLDSAHERASHLPNWLTRSSSSHQQSQSSDSEDEQSSQRKRAKEANE
jgi:hypothetical protein